jgi:ribosomal protein S18 acetylase RimI-like enzyme
MPSIWEIEKRAFSPNERLTKSFLDKLANSPEAIFIQDKQKHGYLLGRPLEAEWRKQFRKKDENYGKCNTIYLRSIAVLPKYQDKGIGKQMFKQFITAARKEGFERISLHTANKKLKWLALKLNFKQDRIDKLDGRKKEYLVKWI